MTQKYLGIRFPFKDSPQGYYLDLTSLSSEAVKSDLIHLLLTTKGERYYLPDFGSNLKKFLFEPMDGITMNDIRKDVQDSVNKYIPNLKIDEIIVEQNENVTPDSDPDAFDYTFTIRINYTVTDDVFASKDFVVLKI